VPLAASLETELAIRASPQPFGAAGDVGCMVVLAPARLAVLRTETSRTGRVFGTVAGFAAAIDLAALNGTNSFGWGA